MGRTWNCRRHDSKDQKQRERRRQQMSVSLCMCVCEYMHVFPFFSPPFFASTLTFIFLQIGYSTFSSNPLSLLHSTSRRKSDPDSFLPSRLLLLHSHTQSHILQTLVSFVILSFVLSCSPLIVVFALLLLEDGVVVLLMTKMNPPRTMYTFLQFLLLPSASSSSSFSSSYLLAHTLILFNLCC